MPLLIVGEGNTVCRAYTSRVWKDALFDPANDSHAGNSFQRGDVRCRKKTFHVMSIAHYGNGVVVDNLLSVCVVTIVLSALVDLDTYIGVNLWSSLGWPPHAQNLVLAHEGPFEGQNTQQGGAASNRGRSEALAAWNENQAESDCGHQILSPIQVIAAFWKRTKSPRTQRIFWLPPCGVSWSGLCRSRSGGLETGSSDVAPGAGPALGQRGPAGLYRTRIPGARAGRTSIPGPDWPMADRWPRTIRA